MNELQIIIAIQRHILREGLKTILNDEPGITVKFAAEHPKEIQELTFEDNDILLLDLDIPDMKASSVVKELLNKYPDLHILAIGEKKNQAIIKQIMQSGVSGYFLKNQRVDELLTAIREIESGEKYIGDKAFQFLVDKDDKNYNYSSSSDLTKRERQILELICEEMTNQEIANKLNISIRTVDAHRQNILHKTRAQNTAGLVKFAIKSQIYSL